MLFCYFQGIHNKKEKQEDINEEEILLREIDQARMEWDIANQHFQDAYHPDMVDYMVFYINAAEKKYMYLLNQYKERYERFRISQRNY